MCKAADLVSVKINKVLLLTLLGGGLISKGNKCIELD